MDSTGLDRYQ